MRYNNGMMNSARTEKLSIIIMLMFSVQEIWLTPKESVYGSKYTSGQIRIALARGNKHLQCEEVDMGSRILQSGLLLGPPNYVERVFSKNETNDEWSKNFHNYSLVWTTGKSEMRNIINRTYRYLFHSLSNTSSPLNDVLDNLLFYVDGKFVKRILEQPSDTVVSVAKLPHNSRYLWLDGSTRLAPFDKEVRTVSYNCHVRYCRTSRPTSTECGATIRTS
jgi:hypothetical protein